MITAKIDTAIADALRAKGINLLDALKLKMTSLMISLEGRIVATKLSGDPLHHRTGKLAGSVHAIPAEMQGTNIVGAVESSGGPAFYGRIHEYGGTFEIPEHIRRIGYGAKGQIVKLLTRGGMVRPQFNKQGYSIGYTTVRAHTATYPERSFMRSALRENSSEIVDSLREVIREALK